MIQEQMIWSTMEEWCSIRVCVIICWWTDEVVMFGWYKNHLRMWWFHIEMKIRVLYNIRTRFILCSHADSFATFFAISFDAFRFPKGNGKPWKYRNRAQVRQKERQKKENKNTIKPPETLFQGIPLRWGFFVLKKEKKESAIGCLEVNWKPRKQAV